jgi:putative two-component system response regulator
MKQHSSIGSHILQGSEASVIQLAEQIALTHHERWDGNGYPSGLRQNEIPMAGRIVAVADAFDALCSKRPYRDAHRYPFEQVFAIILEGSGTQFDPSVVDALITAHDEILAIHAKAHP